MTQKPMISVVVPIYKVEDYLNRCVNSLVNQSYQNIEIILVDDGSPDNCPAMCDAWANKDSRIKVVHKPNGGLSDARNAGVVIASGELLVFIDSDDWVEPDAFKKMYDRMTADNSDVVSCGVRWVYDNGILLRNVTVEQDAILYTQDAMSEIISDGKLKQHVWNKLYKTELVKDILFEKGKYHEDVFWSYQVFGKAKKISIMQESFYNYVQRSDSIMGECYSVKRIDALDAMCQRCEYVKAEFPDLFNKALYTYAGSCMYHLQLAIKSNQSKDVINNIIDRLDYCKTGTFSTCASTKNKMWLSLFLRFPIMISKIRNLLKVGL